MNTLARGKLRQSRDVTRVTLYGVPAGSGLKREMIAEPLYELAERVVHRDSSSAILKGPISEVEPGA